MKSINRYVVLGGSGFIGSSIIKELINKECKIICLDLIKPDFNYDNLEYINMSFNKEYDFETILKEDDIVIHCISTTNARSNKTTYQDFDENVLSTIKLLDACVSKKIKRLIFLSSGGTVYGNSKTLPLKEEYANNAISTYGLQKYVIEQTLYLYKVQYNLDYIVCRIGNIFGANQTIERGVGVICTFVNKIINNEEIQLFGDGNSIRDYIYVTDVIDAIIKLIDYNGKETIFNIGSGIGYTVNELLDIIINNLDKKPIINKIPVYNTDVDNNILDITKIKREIGFNPKYTIEEGIKEVIKLTKKTR